MLVNVTVLYVKKRDLNLAAFLSENQNSAF
jgi:hypothetical protein